jgi:hypothetical protein
MAIAVLGERGHALSRGSSGGRTEVGLRARRDDRRPAPALVTTTSPGLTRARSSRRWTAVATSRTRLLPGATVGGRMAWAMALKAPGYDHSGAHRAARPRRRPSHRRRSARAVQRRPRSARAIERLDGTATSAGVTGGWPARRATVAGANGSGKRASSCRSDAPANRRTRQGRPSSSGAGLSCRPAVWRTTDG